MAANLSLKINRGYTRVYAKDGHLTTNSRGTAIAMMISFTKEGEHLIKAHKRYRKVAGVNAVTYNRFINLVAPFLAIKETVYAKNILDQLDADPRKTIASALDLAWTLSELQTAFMAFTNLAA